MGCNVIKRAFRLWTTWCDFFNLAFLEKEKSRSLKKALKITMYMYMYTGKSEYDMCTLLNKLHVLNLTVQFYPVLSNHIYTS